MLTLLSSGLKAHGSPENEPSSFSHWRERPVPRSLSDHFLKPPKFAPHRSKSKILRSRKMWRSQRKTLRVPHQNRPSRSKVIDSDRYCTLLSERRDRTRNYLNDR